MNALSKNTYQPGLFVDAESMIVNRLPKLARIAAIVVGALLVASLVFVASGVQTERTLRDLGSFAPTIPSFDDQFDPLEVDLYTKPRSNSVALVDIPFDPLLP